jgi:hypothetical protein
MSSFLRSHRDKKDFEKRNEVVVIAVLPGEGGGACQCQRRQKLFLCYFILVPRFEVIPYRPCNGASDTGAKWVMCYLSFGLVTTSGGASNMAGKRGKGHICDKPGE